MTATCPAVRGGNKPTRPLAWGLLLLLVASSATAVELRLQSVTESYGGRDFSLRVESKAVFEFDPENSTLHSSGTWIGENVVGPGQLSRYSYKVENFQIGADGKISTKSYECVEGTFGAHLLSRSLCGNYSFGPNQVDDGGIADDVSNGPARTLDGHRLSSMNWTGELLVITLSEDSPESAAAVASHALTLTFSPETHPEKLTR